MKNILNKIFALLSAILLLVGSVYADISNADLEPEIWEIVSDITKDLSPEAKDVFERATQDLLGYEYYLLGLVAKKSNAYCFLVREGVVAPDASTSIGLLFVSDVEGEAFITASHGLANSTWEGDVQPVNGEVKLDTHVEVELALENYLDDLEGVVYKPLAVYATEAVAGMKYYLLVKSTYVIPNAKSQLQTLVLYKNLQNEVELEEIQTLDLQDMEVQFLDGPGMQIPDPFEENESLAEAAVKLGFGISLPSNLPDAKALIYRTNLRSKMLEIIAYETMAIPEPIHEMYRIRKAEGDSDISGDYIEYSNCITIEVGAKKVLLRGNGEGYVLATWTEGTYSYSLSVEEPSTGNSQEKMIEWVKEIQ